MGTTGATEEDSNSTIGKEVEIVKDERKNIEAAVASDECKDLNAMGEEDTKTPGAKKHPVDSTDKENEKNENNGRI